MQKALTIDTDLKFLIHLFDLLSEKHALAFPHTRLSSQLERPMPHHTHHSYQIGVGHPNIENSFKQKHVMRKACQLMDCSLERPHSKPFMCISKKIEKEVGEP